mgnify:CR=1 FL=1
MRFPRTLNHKDVDSFADEIAGLHNRAVRIRADLLEIDKAMKRSTDFLDIPGHRDYEKLNSRVAELEEEVKTLTRLVEQYEAMG